MRVMRKNRETLETFLKRLDYQLPDELLATEPCKNREDSKLFVVDKNDFRQTHTLFQSLGEFLRDDDVLVVNNARVDPARVHWQRAKQGGKSRQEEIVFLKLLQDGKNESEWEAIVSGRKLEQNHLYELPGGKNFRLIERYSDGTARIAISVDAQGVRGWLNDVGLPPLPPYIRKARKDRRVALHQEEDFQRYQTVYAKEGGAVAAPTAGFHFSNSLISQLKKRGVQFEEVHLAVGWGTFQPLKEDIWDSGILHEEFITLTGEVARRLLAAKKSKRRIIAVGTTSMRVLEFWNRKTALSEEGIKGHCNLFIRPDDQRFFADGLITNFHLPGSSLMALVSAFLETENGPEKLVHLYKDAIKRNYRFYSYGDAMFITKLHGHS